ncbi:MAG: hypothetical protein ACREV0_08150 [Burkholderiales bacterium]
MNTLSSSKYVPGDLNERGYNDSNASWVSTGGSFLGVIGLAGV